MRTLLDQDDVDLIAQRVAEILKPLLASKDKTDDTIFSVEALAQYLCVSPKWVYDHAHELPKFKLGGLLRFKKKEIDKVIDRLALKVNQVP
jgi:predicted DNA-binding transcriptional regulator AlpA